MPTSSRGQATEAESRTRQAVDRSAAAKPSVRSTAKGLPDRRHGLRAGTAERRAAKDKELLERLEHEFRRAGRPTWPNHFAQHVGFAGSKSLRYYPETKKAVNAYGWKTAAHMMRGVRPKSVSEAVAAVDATALEAECGRLRSEVERLTQELAQAQAALGGTATELAEATANLRLARAMVDDLDDYLGHRDVVVARDIEQRLHRLAAEVTGCPERQVQIIQRPQSPPAGPPSLRLLHGGRGTAGEVSQ